MIYETDFKKSNGLGYKRGSHFKTIIYMDRGDKMSDYHVRQLEKVTPFPYKSDYNGIVKIKIQSERGESNWLDIPHDSLYGLDRFLESIAD